MTQFRQLRQFKPHELLFDGSETRVILKFIFRPTDHQQIGFLQSIWSATANPTKVASEVLRKFAKESARSWFEHATVQDLLKVKVYQFVLDHLAAHFRKEIILFSAAKGERKSSTVLTAYHVPRYKHRQNSEAAI
jgi:hypothetical protein